MRWELLGDGFDIGGFPIGWITAGSNVPALTLATAFIQDAPQPVDAPQTVAGEAIQWFPRLFAESGVRPVGP